MDILLQLLSYGVIVARDSAVTVDFGAPMSVQSMSRDIVFYWHSLVIMARTVLELVL